MLARRIVVLQLLLVLGENDATLGDQRQALAKAWIRRKDLHVSEKKMIKKQPTEYKTKLKK
jgi:hypothetical protein